MRTEVLFASLVVMVGCAAEAPAPAPPTAAAAAQPATTASPAAGGPASCATMKGEFDSSAWEGLVASLADGQVKSDVSFALPSILRANVYDTSSWVTVGASGSVRASAGDVALSFGGTGYPPDSSGKVTEVADYRAARTLFDLLVRAKETTKTQATVAAGTDETVTRTSSNGRVECALYRQGVGTQFPREDAYCTFHGLAGSTIERECL